MLGTWRGGEEFAPDQQPGTHGQHYKAPLEPEVWDHFAEQGIPDVRYSIHPCRVIEAPYGNPRADALRRILAACDMAAARGGKLILDVHPAGPGNTMPLIWGNVPMDNTGERTNWMRDWFMKVLPRIQHPAFRGVSLVNEPRGFPGGPTAYRAWCQQMIDAIRGPFCRDRHEIFVPAYDWSGMVRAQQPDSDMHAELLVDPLDLLVHEYHVYLDVDQSGLRYGESTPPTREQIATLIGPALTLLRTRRLVGAVTETGIPNTPAWATSFDALVDVLLSSGVIRDIFIGIAGPVTWVNDVKNINPGPNGEPVAATRVLSRHARLRRVA